MKVKNLNLLPCLLLPLIMYACGQQQEPVQEEATEPAEQTVAVVEEPTVPIILNNSFQGITAGDSISMHEDEMEIGVLSDGEGDHNIYEIMDNNDLIAYVLLNPADDKLVGNIVITSSIPQTEKGINVGQTYGELVNAYGEMEVHGSEIEGRTYAIYDRLFFRLDTPNFSFDVDKEKIGDDTKILEIMIGY